MAKIFETMTLILVAFGAMVMAEDYDVGGDGGWVRPKDPEFYNKWAAGKTFRVGDVLEFEFPQGLHEVALVNQEGYENCNTENPLDLFQISPVKFTLNTTGPHFFLCTLGDHCMFGQRLAITVSSAASQGGSSSSSAPAPAAGKTSPSPAVPATGGSSSSAATPATSTGSSSSAATTPAASTTTTTTTTTTAAAAGSPSEAPSASSAASFAGAGFLAAAMSVVVALLN